MQNRSVPFRRLFTVALVTAVLGGCAWFSGDEEKTATPAEKVPVLEGFKYYVGGPILGNDKYGRQRVKGFNGEVITPPSRGLVFGYREPDPKTFEYYVWVNGKKINFNKGILDEQGHQWPTYRESFQGGKIKARQYFTYDDAKQEMVRKAEALDPETGEVTASREDTVAYVPDPNQYRTVEPEADDEDEEADEDEEEEEGRGAAEP